MRKSGHRLIETADGDTILYHAESMMNKQGVCLGIYTRLPRTDPAVDWGFRKGFNFTDLFRAMKADTAKEAVDILTEAINKKGSQLAISVMDTTEAYLVEGSNWKMGTNENWAVHGPYTDDIFAGANYYVSGKLANHEVGGGGDRLRGKRVYERLVDAYYDNGNTNADPLYPIGGVTLMEMFSIMRDHGPEGQSLEPTTKVARQNPISADLTGNYSVCMHGSIMQTNASIIQVPSPEHTHLLSTTWATFGLPCIGPHLPFPIGITEEPDVVTSGDIWQVFVDLNKAVEYHEEYRDTISDYWTTFEFHTMAATRPLEQSVAELVKAGDEAGAVELLNGFVKETCEDAVARAREMTEMLEDLPIVSPSTETESGAAVR
jgi:hypothetical protein